MKNIFNCRLSLMFLCFCFFPFLVFCAENVEIKNAGFEEGNLSGKSAATAPVPVKEIVKGTNLVLDGDFSESDKGVPSSHWSFGSANPEFFKTEIIEESEGNKALKLICSDSQMSGYWRQDVHVKTNTDYKLKLKIKMESGKSLIWATGNSGGESIQIRMYVQIAADNPFVPLFWKQNWVRRVSAPNSSGFITYSIEPNKWTILEQTFNSGPVSNICVQAGAYFAKGVYYFDDISIEEARR